MDSMGEFIFKVWYMIAILPFFIFIEATKIFAAFLKKRNIYQHWDVWHSLIIVLVILLVTLWMNGYKIIPYYDN